MSSNKNQLPPMTAAEFIIGNNDKYPDLPANWQELYAIMEDFLKEKEKEWGIESNHKNLKFVEMDKQPNAQTPLVEVSSVEVSRGSIAAGALSGLLSNPSIVSMIDEIVAKQNDDAFAMKVIAAMALNATDALIEAMKQ